MAEKETILPEMGFVSEFDEEERRQLGNFGEFLSFSDGEVLTEEGATQDSLFLIVFGTFHVQTGALGRPVLLGTLRSGDTVGEVNIFDPGTASASVISKSVSQVWRIDRSKLEQYLEAHPKEAARLLVGISTQLSKRLRKTNQKVAMAREAVIDAF